jgi:hypothetical protein
MKKRKYEVSMSLFAAPLSISTMVPVDADDTEMAEIAALQTLAWKVEGVEEVAAKGEMEAGKID